MMCLRIAFILFVTILLHLEHSSTLAQTLSVSGLQVQLNCSYRAPTQQGIIIWTFLDPHLPLSENTLIYNSVPPELRQRLNISGDHSNGEYNLLISDLRKSDEGRYECHVYGDASTIQIQRLLVIVGPTSVGLGNRDANNRILGSEGIDLVIHCTSFGGTPAPDMTLQIGTEVYKLDNASSLLHTVTSINRSYDGVPVSCQAGYNNVTMYTPLSDTATIFLNLKPLTPTFRPNLIALEELNPLLITCISEGSRPAPTVRQWYVGNKDVTSNSTVISNTYDPVTDTYTASSTLTYDVDKKFNGMNVSCGFGNAAFGDLTKGTRVINIKFAPTVSVDNKLFNPTASLRQINCVVDGNPPSYSFFKWQHKSVYGKVIRELGGNTTLTLPQVSVDIRYQDTGEYVCTVSNGIKDKDGNTKQQASGFVTSQASPVFLSGNQRTVFSMLKSDIELEVKVYSVPKYTARIWMKGSNTITNSSKYIMAEKSAVLTDTFHGTDVQVDGHIQTLIIRGLEEQDFVNYTLRLGNGFGQMVEHVIIVSLINIPDTPTNLAEVDTTENTITIQWTPAFDGGLEQSFVIQYRVKNTKDFQEAVVTNTDYKSQPGLMNYTLTELKSGTKHEIRIISRNAAGSSPPSKPVTISTICADCDGSNSSLIGVAVGLSTVIVVSLVANGLFAYKLFTGTQKTQRLRKNRSKTTWNKTSTQEVYYNVAENIDDKDEQSTMKKVTYEELGSKDKPNTYEELKSKPDEQSAIRLDTYEDLGSKEKPNEYEELKPKPSDPKFTSDT